MVKDLVEVTLKTSEDFLKVKETLTRIGIPSKGDNTLTQSCHILHKRGKYFIVHFKELFLLDKKTTNYSDDDRARRNTIIKLLVEWNLIDVVNPDQIAQPVAPLSKIKVISFKDKENWTLAPKYTIGNR